QRTKQTQRDPSRRHIYVICEEDEDLREPLELIGEDRIMLGPDIPHSESHPNSFQAFQERSDLSN
ncbi:MAG: hypothetical protein ACREQV_10185, partial [Candidatus Binatia bacterium]